MRTIVSIFIFMIIPLNVICQDVSRQEMQEAFPEVYADTLAIDEFMYNMFNVDLTRLNWKTTVRNLINMFGKDFYHLPNRALLPKLDSILIADFINESESNRMDNMNTGQLKNYFIKNKAETNENEHVWNNVYCDYFTFEKKSDTLFSKEFLRLVSNADLSYAEWSLTKLEKDNMESFALLNFEYLVRLEKLNSSEYLGYKSTLFADNIIEFISPNGEPYRFKTDPNGPNNKFRGLHWLRASLKLISNEEIKDYASFFSVLGKAQGYVWFMQLKLSADAYISQEYYLKTALEKKKWDEHYYDLRLLQVQALLEMAELEEDIIPMLEEINQILRVDLKNRGELPDKIKVQYNMAVAKIWMFIWIEYLKEDVYNVPSYYQAKVTQALFNLNILLSKGKMTNHENIYWKFKSLELCMQYFELDNEYKKSLLAAKGMLNHIEKYKAHFSLLDFELAKNHIDKQKKACSIMANNDVLALLKDRRDMRKGRALSIEKPAFIFSNSRILKQAPYGSTRFRDLNRITEQESIRLSMLLFGDELGTDAIKRNSAVRKVGQLETFNENLSLKLELKDSTILRKNRNIRSQTDTIVTQRKTVKTLVYDRDLWKDTATVYIYLTNQLKQARDSIDTLYISETRLNKQVSEEKELVEDERDKVELAMIKVEETNGLLILALFVVLLFALALIVLLIRLRNSRHLIMKQRDNIEVQRNNIEEQRNNIEGLYESMGQITHLGRDLIGEIYRTKIDQEGDDKRVLVQENLLMLISRIFAIFHNNNSPKIKFQTIEQEIDFADKIIKANYYSLFEKDKVFEGKQPKDYITVDPNIRQFKLPLYILVNSIQNSFKYTRKDVNFHIRIFAEKHAGGIWRLIIEDEGEKTKKSQSSNSETGLKYIERRLKRKGFNPDIQFEEKPNGSVLSFNIEKYD